MFPLFSILLFTVPIQGCFLLQESLVASFLEALSVNDGRTRLVVFGLGDPHLLEGRKRSQDRTTNPDGVLSLGRSDDLDLHGSGSQGGEFLGQSLGNTGVHGGTARKDDVGVEILSDIDITLHDGLEGTVVDTRSFLADERRLEENFGASESLVTDDDDVTVGELVALLQGGGFGGGGHLGIEVEGDVGELLLDVSDDFSFGGGGERVTSFGEDLHQVIGQISTSEIQSDDGVRKSISFVDGDSVGHTITRVEDATGGSARSVQGKDGLDVHVHGGNVEGLEHDLGHSFSVSLGVEGGFGQEDGVFLGGDSELIVEGVVPDLLHIVPVGDDTVLNGVLEGEDTSLGLSFVSDVSILLVHTDHDTGVLGSSDD